VTLVLALFIFLSAAGVANRADPANRVKFEKKHRSWMRKTFPGYKPLKEKP
jgi:hypothetical protein